jgi:hypothetical protein
MISLTFALVLRRSSVLPRLLLLCYRLGGTVTYLSAADEHVSIVLSAPKKNAHRFAPQLRRIIDVLELSELHTVPAEQDPRSPRDLLYRAAPVRKRSRAIAKAS